MKQSEQTNQAQVFEQLKKELENEQGRLSEARSRHCRESSDMSRGQGLGCTVPSSLVCQSLTGRLLGEGNCQL